MSAAIRLPDDQLEQLADMIAERKPPEIPAFVTAPELADILHVSVDAVYASKDEFGAIRIGKPGSKRAVYRFDLSRALRLSAEAPAPARRARTKRSDASAPSDVPLLPIKGQRRATDR
jgi:hypothetical protein